MRADIHRGVVRRAARGYALGELLVAAAIGIVVTTLVVGVIGRTVALRAAAVPSIHATDVQSAVALDIRLAVSDAAAKVPYLDLAAMYRSLGKPGSGEKPASSKPAGGEGGDGEIVTGTKPVQAVFRYGPAPRLGELEIGPVTIPEKPLVDGQSGDALVVLRTDPAVGRLALARDFSSSADRLHLVARRGVSDAHVEALAEGDVLMLTGTSLTGSIVSCLVLVTGKPEPETPEAEQEGPFAYYGIPASCGAKASYPWGLRNPASVDEAETVQVSSDASVAKLLAPRTYVVRDGTLYVAEGALDATINKVPDGDDPLRPLATGVDALDARAMLVDRTTAETVTGADANRVRSLEVTLAVTPVEAAAGGERELAPRVVTIDMQPWTQRLDGASTDLVYAFATTEDDDTEGPGEPGGPGPGWCLAVANDPESWPQGVDPQDPSTWTRAEWWEGFVKSDPSTWYYRCEGTGGGK